MKTNESRAVTAFRYFFLVGLAIFYLVPFYALINTSLKSNEEIISGAVLLVQNVYLGGYVKALHEILRPMMNSFIVATAATVISGIVGAMTGYIFSKYPFRYSNIIFVTVILGLYIAPQSILIPLVRVMGMIGLYNTYWGLILTHVGFGVPYTTLLFKNYFESIPRSLIEMASIDGCSVAEIFVRIIMPLAGPGFAVVGIFQFTNIWNEFLFGLTLTRGKDFQPITVAVSNLV